MELFYESNKLTVRISDEKSLSFPYDEKLVRPKDEIVGEIASAICSALESDESILTTLDGLIKNREEKNSIHDGVPRRDALVYVSGKKNDAVALEVLKSSNPYTACLSDCETGKKMLNAYNGAKKNIEIVRTGFKEEERDDLLVSSLLALMTAYLNGIRYIAASFTSGDDDTFRTFEGEFGRYISIMTDADIFYFSILGNINELQASGIFSEQYKYFSCFNDCEKDMRSGKMCGHCKECLLDYILLTPFMMEMDIILLYTKKLLDDVTLVKEIRSLLGVDNKPYTGPGSVKEVWAALSFYLKSGNQGYLIKGFENNIREKNESITSLLLSRNNDSYMPKDFQNAVENKLREVFG